MLKRLSLTGVGPAATFGPVDFAPRLNFITGDNGLGKSFLLDAAWYVLTRTWARDVPIVPRVNTADCLITYGLEGQPERMIRCHAGRWSAGQDPQADPAVVIYAGNDGSFSAWDPQRNAAADTSAPDQEAIHAFHFSAEQVWQGARSARGTNLCNGLIHDWVRWQQAGSRPFEELVRVLGALSPSEHEQLTPGEPCYLGPLDETQYPTLRQAYGEVPLNQASAGMRRIAALAYMLVWTWNAHLRACRLRSVSPASHVVFLMDEIECHLHPQWQRRIVPALLAVVRAMTGSQVAVQIILATHSPLVMASAEPDFEEGLDAVFTVQLEQGRAKVEQAIWAKQGDVVNWLVCDVFGLDQARSLEAEQAIAAADAWMLGEYEQLPPGLDSREAIHDELLRVLPSGDHFWPCWIVSAGEHVL
ncbi:AAA family ATPase [Pseudomonas abieticivorans]|uniref:AAA family ATPase n=1 Tax=Pseudomonas abieticivorans TaxID=2931382 RepID=UPI0020BE4E86|nr:AAA family ATPase [Pseudomonas sp. PIA16]